MSNFDLTPPTDAEHRARAATLTDAERRVLLEHGTEAAFCVMWSVSDSDENTTCLRS